LKLVLTNQQINISASTLMVGHQKKHPNCKKLNDEVLEQDVNNLNM